MWKNPKRMHELVATANWGEFMDGGLYQVAIGDTPPVVSTSEAMRWMWGLLGDLSYAFVKNAQIAVARNQPPPRKFLAMHRQVLDRAVAYVEESGRYDLIPELSQAVYDINMVDGNGTAAQVAGSVAKMIHILVGDERRWLAGTHHNVPVWRTFDHPIGSGRMKHLLMAPWLNLSMNLDYISEANAGLVPDPLSLAKEPDDLMRQIETQTVTYQELGAMMRDALAEQRYFLNSEGLRIQFRGHAMFDSVEMVICSDDGEFNSAYLIATFETPTGPWFKVLDLYTVTSEVAINEPSLVTDFTLVSMYYLLTTAEEVPVGPRLPAAPSIDDAPPPEGDWWVTIPRTVDIEPFRTPVSSGRHVREHVVYPYRRRLVKGNMSARQWEEVKKYCLSHNLPLPEVPPGYTYVLEHRRGSSPASL